MNSTNQMSIREAFIKKIMLLENPNSEYIKFLDEILERLLKEEKNASEAEWNAMPEIQRTRILQALKSYEKGEFLSNEEVWAKVDQMMKR